MTPPPMTTRSAVGGSRSANLTRIGRSVGRYDSSMSRSERADVVIIGGAIVGSSIATFLAMRPDFDGRIVVVDRDPTFRTSSQTLSAARIRLQFSLLSNIDLIS